jgi:GNAT superfamily N-acetyltransferase
VSGFRDRFARALSIPYCPHTPTPPQLRFLSVPAREALYGGAAGGGKSDALLMAALQYAHVPGYSALLLRRTYQDLRLPDALMERAATWLRGTGATWSGDDKRWTLPCPGGGSSSLTFGYCETPADVFRYQGAQVQFVGIDELTQWTERPYLYLNSRLRRLVGSSIPIRIRSASNPGGVGHSWVKARFVDPGDASRPFIPARLDDNPHLDVAEYRASLAVLDATTRDQLERGLWVLDTTGRVYRYDRALNTIDALPEREWRTVLGCDLGASERKATTAFALWHFSAHDPVAYCSRAWKLPGLIPSSFAEEVRAVLEVYPEAVVVLDEGALGKGYGGELRTRYGIPAKAAQKRDKLGFRKLLNGELERGLIKVVAGDCEPLIAEWESLVWDKDGLDVAPGLDDHASDAALYGWREARAYASTAAPDPRPKPYSAEWHAQRERDALAAEERAWRREQTDPWENW